MDEEDVDSIESTGDTGSFATGKSRSLSGVYLSWDLEGAKWRYSLDLPGPGYILDR